MTEYAITRYVPETQLWLSNKTIEETVLFDDETRRLPTHVVAGSGSGKSLWAARLALWDLLRGRPQVILEPGQGIRNALFHEICQLPSDVAEEAWSRIHYTDLAATDYVDPIQMFEDSYDESLMARAERLTELFILSDPDLKSASREGANALEESGGAALRVALALGGNLLEAVDMLNDPKKWRPRYAEALHAHPEIYDAVVYMRNLASMNPSARRRETGSFLTKARKIIARPEFNARFCSTRSGITMQDVAETSMTWIISTHGLTEQQKNQWLLWFLQTVTRFAEHRGATGRKALIGLMIDEITEFLGFGNAQNEIMEALIEKLISKDSRNLGIMTTILHQSLVQISSERIRGALMSMPNQFIGMIHNPYDRLYLADQFLLYDPYRIKERIPQYVNHPYPKFIDRGFRDPATIFSEADYSINHYVNTYFTIDEQLRIFADRFKPGNLNKFEFLTRIAENEGTFSSQDLQFMEFLPFEGGFPDTVLCGDIGQYLKERNGFPCEQLLAENIKRIKKAWVSESAKNKLAEHATIATTSSPALPHEQRDKDIRAESKNKRAPQPNTSWEEQFYEGAEEEHDAG